MAISLDSPVPLTKLDAVNIILRSRGQGPTATLGDDARGAAREALEALGAASLEVQGGDWNFNKDRKLKLTPNGSGDISVPAGLLGFVPTYTSVSKSLSQRGTRFYDLDNSTFKFTGPIYIEATIALPFEELPQAARWYITMLASYAFGNQNVPGDASLRPTSEQLSRAKANLESYDSKLVNRNLRTNPHFYRLRRRR